MPRRTQSDRDGKTNVTIHMPQKLIRELDQLATHARRSRTQQVLHMLEEWMRNTNQSAESAGISSGISTN